MDSSLSSGMSFEGNPKVSLKLSLAIEKDPEIQSEQNGQGELRKLEPEWLENFFKRTFFLPCSEHTVRRNELNKYCIDCDASLCQFCVSVASHDDHRLLKIYRHVYKDVVPLDEIEQHVDCSEIQPYRCNKQLVIALTPLPHSGSKTSDDEATCLICKRKLIEYDIYSYCSIACKVEAFTKKENDDSPPFLSLDYLVENGKEESQVKKPTVNQAAKNANQGSELKKTAVVQPVEKEGIVLKRKTPGEPEPEMKMLAFDQLVQTANQPPPVVNFRTRKRKGTPRRSPFF
ncbi:hypothetical protein RND81_10G152500 [Saponaria officinalis]